MPTPEPKRRWFRLSPDRFVAGLFLAICLLWLSEQFQWFGFNSHKGWTVLIAVAAIGVAAVVMPLWWTVSLICRWRFQFGIRSLLAFCLAASIAACWLAAEMQRAGRQKEMVNWLESSGGSGHYDWEVDAEGNEIVNPEPPGPVWLQRMLGDDFFSAVVQVALTDTNTTDVGLEQLKELSRLNWLSLTATKITDAGLEHLKGLTQIQTLWLSDTKITDTGLEYLKELTHLRGLDFSGTKITDTGLEHLGGMKQIRVLSLLGTAVTDAGVERLQHSLPNCKILH